MISIVIPLYNKENSIAGTLKAVLKQTFQDFEIVIVNDGSTDNSLSEVQSIKDDRIRIINQPNSGVASARNRGIEEAKCDLIAFLDADDEWRDEYLQTQYNLFKKYPDCGVYACNYEFKDSLGKVVNTIIHKLPFDGTDGILTNYFEVASCSHPPLWTSAIVVKKTVVKSIGGFPNGVKSGEDLLTWARLACNCQIAYSRMPLAMYNLGEGYDMTKLPPRRQDEGDPVGRELKAIYIGNKDIIGLRKYIALWHKMRASVALRFGLRFETWKESLISIYYYPGNIMVYLFIILAFLPNIIQRRIISQYKKLNMK